MSKSTKIALLVIVILILDQSLKIWVKTHMTMNADIKLLGLDWAHLHFIENPGMAFGMEIQGKYGKLILSLFRIGAVGGLIYLIRSFMKAGAPLGLLLSFGLVLAGAIGNIIDSAFYGMIFSASKTHGGEVAMLFPPEGGYAPFLYGKVVDMFYFPIFNGYFPDWFPFWAGEKFTFFKPVFNIADAAITVGVFSLIFFHRGFFNTDLEEAKKKAAENSPAEQANEIAAQTSETDSAVDTSTTTTTSTESEQPESE